jgi:hypothetical protein
MHLEILVGGIAEEFGAAGAEIGEAGDILLWRQGGCSMEMDRGHLSLLHWFD